MRVRITLSGCDDETTGYATVTEDEAQTIRQVAAWTREWSGYGCPPVMIVEEVE